MNEELQIFIATIYGESAVSSPIAWQAIAHVIKNRFNYREWKKYKTLKEIIQHTGFDAYTFANQPYRNCRDYLWALDKGGPLKFNKRIADLIATVVPVYNRETTNTADITGGSVLYFSPKAQEALHKRDPQRYKSIVPYWSKSQLVEEYKVPGLLDTDDFRFYRYIENRKAPVV